MKYSEICQNGHAPKLALIGCNFISYYKLKLEREKYVNNNNSKFNSSNVGSFLSCIQLSDTSFVGKLDFMGML